MAGEPVLGIDLGTTNSVVAVADAGQARVLTDLDGRRLLPSVVSFHPDGTTLVGYEARERRLIDAENTVYGVKRLIGRPFASEEVLRARQQLAFQLDANRHGGCVVKVRRGTYALAEISAMVLRTAKELAEAALGIEPSEAVITVPANFNELQRSATKAAGKVAGLHVLRILNEPTAAALAYGHGQSGQSERVAVYDLGGGTFDITLLELEEDVYEVLATAGDSFLGGDDIDVMLAETMAAQFAEAHRWDPRGDAQTFERLRAAAEWAKCQLSSHAYVELSVEELHLGPRGKPLDLHFASAREQLEAMARPWLERTFDVCRRALSNAGLEPRDLNAVVLVGGSTRMPLIRQRVSEFFGMPARTDLDPDMVVAQGAAIHGAALKGSLGSSRRHGASRAGGAEGSRDQDAGAGPAGRKELARIRPKRMTAAELRRRTRSQPEPRPRQPAFAPDRLPRPPPKPARPLGAKTSRARPPPPSSLADQDQRSPPRGTPTLDDLDELARPRDAAGAPTTAPAWAQTDDPFAVPIHPAGPAETSDPAHSARPAHSAKPVQMAASVDLPPGDRTAAPSPKAPRVPVRLDLPFGMEDARPAASAPSAASGPGAPQPPARGRPRAKRGAPPPTPPLPARGLPTLDLEEDLEALPEPAVAPSGHPPTPPPRADPTRVLSQVETRAPEPTAVAPEALDMSDLEIVSGDAPQSDVPQSVLPQSDAAQPPREALPIPALGAPAETPATEDPTTGSVESRFDAPAAVLPIPEKAPLLMDVTPLSLGVEMAGGYMRALIASNAPLPTEQSRTFTTVRDGQTEVAVRICQGEHERFEDNEVLGEVVLSELPAHPRGQVLIQVLFMLDADGTLAVQAKDRSTGRSQKTNIQLASGLDDADIEAMRARQEREFALDAGESA